MGQYKIEITAIGGHGCDRTAREGDPLFNRCQRLSCPDCLAADFVARLRSTQSVEAATFTHWPTTSQEVQDDLLANKRIKGAF